MNTPLQKRFWKDVSIRPEAAGFGVFLDEGQLKTPLKSSLLAPTKAVAEGIAAEWDAVDEKIDPSKMHLTRCANATIDKVVQEHGAVAAMLAAYGGTDLLCYRAGSPEELVARQAAAWDPMLDWISTDHGVELKQTIGVMHLKQSAESQEKLHAMVVAHDPWRLTALHDLVTISGSLVLGLAVATRYMSAEDVWPLSRIDEVWQEEQWGEDEDAAKTVVLKRGDFLDAARLLDLLAAD